ncbi:RNA-binding protein, partial [Trypanosoma grayi]|uniref:RNA-binding protein n=1 Tax=Trypanosoma grayi TaxID=71804 RepID=UPI0004F41FC9
MAQVNQQRFGCYIGNIDRSVTLEVLRQVFSQCGTIIDCSLNGRDEDPYRYGFIDFASEDDRARAMKYNGFTLAGRKIKVGVSKGNVGRPEGYNNTSNNNNNSSSNNNNNGGGGGGGGGGNTNNPQQQLQQPQAPAMALAANFLPAVVQQQSTQLLMNLIQRGAVDVNLLTPEQQQALMASLIPPAAAQAAGVAAIQQAAPMPYVPMPQQP